MRELEKLRDNINNGRIPPEFNIQAINIPTIKNRKADEKLTPEQKIRRIVALIYWKFFYNVYQGVNVRTMYRNSNAMWDEGLLKALMVFYLQKCAYSMQQKDHLMKRLFACESVWPCVAYLAAYHDKYQCTGRKISLVTH